MVVLSITKPHIVYNQTLMTFTHGPSTASPHSDLGHTMELIFVTDLPYSQAQTILNLVDCFSKVCCLVPLTKLLIALETAEILFCEVFRLYGLPEDIVSGRDIKFNSQVWQGF